MRNIFNFVKKHSWVIILILVVLAIIGDNIITSRQKPSPTPTPIAQVATFKNITPGISTESDLNKIWGTPTRTTINGPQTIDTYKGVGFKDQTAVIEGGKVKLIRQVIASTDTTKASTITDVYGPAPYILYSKFPNYVFRLFVYPSNGIAYLGATNGTLSEIWYFVPTTIDNFASLWATDYSFSTPAPAQ